MNVALLTDRQGDRASITPTGAFDLPHAMSAAQAVENVEARLSGCVSVDVDLAQLERIDGAGAVLLARLCDRLDAAAHHPLLIEGQNREAARLIAHYRERRGDLTARQTREMSPLMRIGALAASLPGKANEIFDFTGRCAAALPKVVAAPGSVDWLSLPRLIQEIGADALLVACRSDFVSTYAAGWV